MAYRFFDQLAYSLTCPQGKGQLQLIRASVGNQTNNSGGLMTGQTRLVFGTTFVRLQCSIAAGESILPSCVFITVHTIIKHMLVTQTDRFGAYADKCFDKKYLYARRVDAY
jgi:hypothetical protein